MKELIQRNYNAATSKGDIGIFTTPETLMADLEAKASNLVFMYEKYKVLDNKGSIDRLMDLVGHIFNILIRHKLEPSEEFKNHIEYIESLLNIENDEAI